ncbi:hypothetical protein CFAEC_12610 [Corynebacterium faecale]|nr:hypothetical protein CFAEC_12610 [Corynebacterium faecale]
MVNFQFFYGTQSEPEVNHLCLATEITNPMKHGCDVGSQIRPSHFEQPTVLFVVTTNNQLRKIMFPELALVAIHIS